MSLDRSVKNTKTRAVFCVFCVFLFLHALVKLGVFEKNLRKLFVYVNY